MGYKVWERPIRHYKLEEGNVKEQLREVQTRASQNFWSYLPHSVLSSEWAGATLVGFSEG